MKNILHTSNKYKKKIPILKNFIVLELVLYAYTIIKLTFCVIVIWYLYMALFMVAPDVEVIYHSQQHLCHFFIAHLLGRITQVMFIRLNHNKKKSLFRQFFLKPRSNTSKCCEVAIRYFFCMSINSSVLVQQFPLRIEFFLFNFKKILE